MFVLDFLFLGVTGIDHERGATLSEPEEAAVLRDIDLLITDDGSSDEASRAFSASDIQVLAVCPTRCD
jgi:DeoR/GlpR family transcriptional regulator of sugar metabolism